MKKGNLTKRQSGIVLPLVAVAMLALVAMTGLALDMGHAYVNKTRLQNALDAAALSAAKTLELTASTAQATAAAMATFNQNVAGSGNSEMSSIAAGDVDVTYSHTLDPFASGTAPPMFVRVAVNNYTLGSWFIQALGFNNKTVGASAVAGPSPELLKVCDVLPIMACGDPDVGEAGNYGYDPTSNDEITLKTGAQSGWDVGVGNFQNIELECGPGADCVRNGLAGAYSSCPSSGDTLATKPGSSVGPNAQGLNTRFGCPPPGCGPIDTTLYPPDKVTDAGGGGYPDTYAMYQSDYGIPDFDYANGVEDRRMVVVPIGNCTGTTNGQGTVELLGFGCFFLTRPAEHQGLLQTIYGQFRETCTAAGVPGPDPDIVPGPKTIILYKDFTAGNLDS
ncbi:MAG: Tad domain-containing protein [Pseudomonadota bacterium]